MRKQLHYSSTQDNTGEILDRLSLNTICRESKCPNWGECWSQGHATFMLLGDTCTRNCGFCSVKTGRPGAWDPTEPVRVAQAVREMGLSYVVITSVDRDDLPDLGSAAFAATIQEIKKLSPAIQIEVLVPDFKGEARAIKTVLDVEPEVFVHNLETVPRLNKKVRPQASYQRSLEVFRIVQRLAPSQITKSGLMLGLGETEQEIISVMEDLRTVGCELLSIGQYLYPGGACLPVERFAPLEEFAKYKKIGRSLGFAAVMAGPYVRTSYRAKELYQEAKKQRNKDAEKVVL